MCEVETKIVDGPVVVNMLEPKASTTFGDYAEDVFWSIYCRHWKYVWVLFGTVTSREDLEVPQGKSAVQVVGSL